MSYNLFIITINISCFCVFMFIVILKNRERKVKLSLNFRFNNIKFLGLILLGVCIFQIGISLPASTLISPILKSKTFLTNPLKPAEYVISVIILAPIIEEIIFRGVFLNGLLKTYSPKVSIIISSFLFAIIHIKPIQIFVALVLGHILGYTYYKTKSMGNVILLHAIANIVGLLGKYIDYKTYFYTEITLNWYGIILILISFITIVIVWIYIKIKFKHIQDK